MGSNIVQKILETHLVEGETVPGETVSIKVDQVLTQDATGTMAYLEFEAIGVDRIKVPLAVSYVDHNILQTDFRNPDDHLYLQTAAAKYGAYFSKPGNGICHQVHLERFAAPGKVLIGSDSHTPNAGGIGSLAIGAGGLDVATVMAGMPFRFPMPEVIRVELKGDIERPWVTAMDVILELIGRMGVKGGVSKILEYGGPGVKNLNVTERATITNMGTELGATTSIFPSDEVTLRYLKAQGREKDWVKLEADADAEYSEVIELDLSEVEPLVAKPFSPGNVAKIRELEGLKVDQVCIGSCTNSSYQVMVNVAQILRGKTIAPWCSLTINPGSKQVFEMIAKNGALADMISAGARILECACGPCIGMGQAPRTNGVSVRSFNRNFKGRSGTPNAKVYLCNPLAAAVIALKGEIVDPRNQGINITPAAEPEKFILNDNLIIPPSDDPEKVEVIRGPNIKPVPIKDPLENEITSEVLIKLGDNVSTDDIMPAGSHILPFRSNIPELSKFAFYHVDPTFYERAKKAGSGVILGGENYGQGSSREHAALVPMYLGIKAVIAKSFARIHRSNLINFGILPLTFRNPEDYQKIEQGDKLRIVNVLAKIESGEKLVDCLDETTGYKFQLNINLTKYEAEVVKAGGLLPYTKKVLKT
ncbi:MAG: aconitate hydratase [Candidatus Odinarchaeia archaeon]